MTQSSEVLSSWGHNWFTCPRGQGRGHGEIKCHEDEDSMRTPDLLSSVQVCIWVNKMQSLLFIRTKKNILCWYPFFDNFCKHPSRTNSLLGWMILSIPTKSLCNSINFCKFSWKGKRLVLNDRSVSNNDKSGKGGKSEVYLPWPNCTVTENIYRALIEGGGLGHVVDLSLGMLWGKRVNQDWTKAWQ